MSDKKGSAHDKRPITERGSDLMTKIVEWPAIFCGILLMAAAIGVTIEVVVRKLLNISLGGAHELSGYVLAITTAWGFSLALVHRAHIRIDVLYQKLGPRLKAVLDIFSLIALLILSFYLTRFCWSVLETTLRRGSTANTPLQTPLWIPQSLWYSGIVIFNIVVVIFLLFAIYDLIRRNWASISYYAGVRSSEDELAEAMHDAGHEFEPSDKTST